MTCTNDDSPFGSVIHPLGVVTWGALHLITLGFSRKYSERLRSFERLDPQHAIEDFDAYTYNHPRPKFYSEIPLGVKFKYEPYQSPPTYLGQPYRLDNSEDNCDGDNPIFDRVNLDYDEPLRARQQGEWEKLSTAASVISATSAAALAIPDMAGTKAHWMINTCFCTALGLSLEGLILVFYITIMAGGASDETIGRLARGKVTFLGSYKMSPKFPTLVMALPVVFTTWSSLFLLIGCMVMIIKSPTPASSAPNPCYYLPLVTIGIGLVCVCSAVLVSEVAMHNEGQLRDEKRKEWPEKQRENVLRAIPLSMMVSLQVMRAQVGMNASESGPNIVRFPTPNSTGSAGTIERPVHTTKKHFGQEV